MTAITFAILALVYEVQSHRGVSSFFAVSACLFVVIEYGTSLTKTFRE